MAAAVRSRNKERRDPLPGRPDDFLSGRWNHGAVAGFRLLRAFHRAYRGGDVLALQQLGPKGQTETGRGCLHHGGPDLAIITIDFEASCLPRHGRSFPIEVGIAGVGTTRSWLIRPHDDWQGWDWTSRAQALHGLRREQIARDGLDVAQVLGELTTAVAGHRLVADSLIDQYWMDTLAAASHGRSLAIDHVSMVMDELGVGEERLGRALDQADRLVAARHRAAEDARWLAAVIVELGGQIAAFDQPLPMLALQDCHG
jgi:hypothetical protein